jgi:hypothetical protein
MVAVPTALLAATAAFITAAAPSAAAAGDSRPRAKAAPAAALDWASTPVAANETVLLLGGPFTAASKVSLSPPGSVAAVFAPVALQPSASSIKFVLPPGTGDAAGLAQWDISVDGSAPLTLNAPQPWWAMGDRRRTATAGGYIRVFGSCLWFDGAVAETAALAEADEALRRTLGQLGQGSSAVDASEQALRRLAGAREVSDTAVAASASRLRLTPVGGGGSAASVTIMSAASNTSQWSAWFNLPSSIKPGEYSVSVANHLAPDNFVALGAHGSFVSPSEPKVTTVTVVGPPPLTPKKVFNVSEYGPHGLPTPGEYHTWTNASVAIERAIAAAAAAGGGVVFFERGTYVNQPLSLYS